MNCVIIIILYLPVKKYLKWWAQIYFSFLSQADQLREKEKRVSLLLILSKTTTKKPDHFPSLEWYIMNPLCLLHLLQEVFFSVVTLSFPQPITEVSVLDLGLLTTLNQMSLKFTCSEECYLGVGRWKWLDGHDQGVCGETLLRSWFWELKQIWFRKS